MSATEKKIERKRKPAARRTDIVIALIEERLGMVTLVADDDIHRLRLFELLDELRRSLGKREEPEAE